MTVTKMFAAIFSIYISYAIHSYCKSGTIPDLVGIEVNKKDDFILFWVAIFFFILVDVLFIWYAFLS